MISIIVAIDPNYLIGQNGKLPWNIKEDLKHFKEYTLNKTVLMGKTTFDSIGKPLPNRNNIVCYNGPEEISIEGVTIINDALKVFEQYKESVEELVVIGGASIYKLALPYASKLIISHIKKEYVGDIYFPKFEENFNCIDTKEYEEFVVKSYLKK